jgi:hypothetical protein
MNKELQAIQDAWDKEVGGGRDETKARTLADKYVKAHPDEFASFADMDVHQCVKAVDVFREAGMEEDKRRVDTWILHRFDPQQIGGPAEATVRIV